MHVNLAGPPPRGLYTRVKALRACRRRRILLIAHDLRRTGAPIALLNYLRWLVAQGVDVETLALAEGPMQDDYRALAPLKFIPSWLARAERRARRRGSSRSIGAVRLIYSGWIRASFSNVAVVHANTITLGAITRRFSNAGIPVVTHVHELSHWIEHRVPRADVEDAIASSQYFVAVSEGVARHLRDRFAIEAHRVTVVHELVPYCPPTQIGRASIREFLGIGDDVFLVGGCGTADWRKGPDLFLQVGLHALKRSAPGALRFVWLGGLPGSEDFARVQHDLERMRLGGAISFVGSIDEPAQWFSAFDAFALTSREDPFPLVMQEAAAAAVPIVAFAGSGGADEFVLSGQTGALVPYADCRSMAEIILKWMDDPDLVRDMGMRSRRRVREEYDSEKLAQRLLEVDRLATRQPRVPASGSSC